ncbi:hypothetical protein JCM8097_006708 [Rhodosporidiobolus ruineniae]
MTSEQGSTLHPLLDSAPHSSTLDSFLRSLLPTDSSSSTPPVLPEPKIDTYPDITYHSYHSLGLSLSFVPSPGSSSSTSSPPDSSLRCNGIDIYNASVPPPPPKPGRRAKAPDYAPFPRFPVLLPSSSSSPSKGALVPFTPETTGKELVDALGEPTKKGGGWQVGIWTEWEVEVEEGREKGKVCVHVEWASSGLGAWDKGGESGWRCLSANAIQKAALDTIASGTRTKDLGGKSSTEEFTQAILQKLRAA